MRITTPPSPHIPKAGKPLTPAQRAMVRLLAEIAVEDFLREQPRQDSSQQVAQ